MSRDSALDRRAPTELGETGVSALPPCLSRAHVQLAPATAAGALDEALRHPKGGEVAVRSGDTVAVLHVHEGSIAWAHVSSHPVRMEEVLQAAGVAPDPELIATLKDESRATGAHFMDLLIRWGLCSEEQAHTALSMLVSQNVCAALQLPDAVALFLPKVRSYHGRMTVRPEELTPQGAPCLHLPLPAHGESRPTSEVVPAPRSQGASPPSVAASAVMPCLHEIMTMDGALGAVAVELPTRRLLASQGDPLDPVLLDTQVRNLAALGPDAEDVIAKAGTTSYLARRLGGAPRVAVLVAVASAQTNMGLARATFARITR